MFSLTQVFRQRETFFSDEGPSLETVDFTIRIYRQYTNHFKFRFVSQHCLRSTAHFMFLSDAARAYVRNVRLYFLYRQYVNLFIFQFVFEHCLRGTLHFMFLSNEGPTFETLDFTFYIGSTRTFLYFDLYFNTAYATHYVYFTFLEVRLNGHVLQ